jgi:hypothetical protein
MAGLSDTCHRVTAPLRSQAARWLIQAACFLRMRHSLFGRAGSGSVPATGIIVVDPVSHHEHV